MLPAARFAALSHMLMNGFFFNQGLVISFFRGFQGCGSDFKAHCGRRYRETVARSFMDTLWLVHSVTTAFE